jgi:hypothetical protein
MEGRSHLRRGGSGGAIVGLEECDRRANPTQPRSPARENPKRTSPTLAKAKTAIAVLTTQNNHPSASQNTIAHSPPALPIIGREIAGCVAIAVLTQRK